MRRFSEVLGIKIDRFTKSELLKKIDEFAASGRTHQVVYVNADCANKFIIDKRYREIVEGADLVYPDGMGIVWASKFAKEPLTERLSLGDFMDDLCKLCVERGYKIFLLGGERGVAKRAAENLKRMFKDLNIAGAHHGFFKDSEEEGLLGEIKKAAPDILLVGMGVPVQEKWIKRNIDKINVPVCWGVGALFDYYAGKAARAPLFLRKAGFEWLFRLLLEPGRLWKRYILGNTFFLARLFGLIISDAALISFAWLASYYIRRSLDGLFGIPVNKIDIYLKALPIYVALWIAVSIFFGLYKRWKGITDIEELLCIFKTVLLGLLVVMSLSFLFKEFDFARFVVILSGILNLLLLYISRWIFSLWDARMAKSGFRRPPVLIIGKGELALRLKEELEDMAEGYKVIALIDERDTGRLNQLIEEKRVEEVYIASENMKLWEELNLVAMEENQSVQFKIVSEGLNKFAQHVDTDRIMAMPVVELGEFEPKPGYDFIKRVFDIMVSIAGIIISIPLSILIAIAIRIESQGPALFAHERVGKDGKLFMMFKFRTMFEDADRYDMAPNKMDDPRVTKVGRILRRTSLDELPQLFNVFKGDMAIIGPRPEMPFIVKNYKNWQMKRLKVKPGITGLWQVVGRKDLPLHKNLEYDFYYIRNRSLLLDAVILLRTMPALMTRKGAY